MEHHHPDADSPSSHSIPLRRRRHHSPICLTACFRPSGDGGDSGSPGGGSVPALQLPSPSAWSQLPSPSTWFRSKAQDLPDLRQKCRNLVSRGGGHHRRHRSADFRYDPLSYSLNFDEGAAEGEPHGAEELRYSTFSSRLPASPPIPVRAAGDRERPLQGIGSGLEAPL